MSRLTKSYVAVNGNTYYEKVENPMISYLDVSTKLGKLEDLMEKYEIESLEELEELIKDYDDMAKSIVEMGLGIKVEIKDKSE